MQINQLNTRKWTANEYKVLANVILLLLKKESLLQFDIYETDNVDSREVVLGQQAF